MRYQQFASHAYCGAAEPVSKMASQQEKSFCVLRFEVSRSVITVRREFRARFRKDTPHRNNITRWYRQFVEIGCLCKGKSPGRPRVSDDSGHATPSLGWIWLLCGRVSCGRGCTHWRIVINAWETWTVAAADGVRFARVRWEINFLFTFETAPFFCVCPVFSHFFSRVWSACLDYTAQNMMFAVTFLDKHVHSCMSDGIVSSVDFLDYRLDDRGICDLFTCRNKGLCKRLLKAAAESDV